MSKYIYQAIDAEGKRGKGSIEAETEENFKLEVKRLGLYLLNYSVGAGNKQVVSGTIATKELSVICRQFSTMLNAGVSIVKSLDVLREQTTNNRTKAILGAVMEDVRKGTSLHKAMANQGKAFPFYLVSSVESGEESGSLDAVMKRMSEYFEKQYKTARQVRSAMIYPCILAFLCVLVVTVLLLFVVPKFVTMYASQGADLPGPTKLLLAITNFLINKWWMVIIVVGVIIMAVISIKTLPSTKTGWDKAMLNIPVFGKLRKVVVTSKFSHTLSTLSASGISMLVSLEVVSRVINNAYVSECISIIIDDLKRGVTLSDSIRKFDIFPPMFKSMIAIGEESGELDALMEKTAAFYEDESEAAVKKMVAFVEPIMIVIMAVIIAFIVISVLLPIYSMYQNMYK